MLINSQKYKPKNFYYNTTYVEPYYQWYNLRWAEPLTKMYPL